MTHTLWMVGSNGVNWVVEASNSKRVEPDEKRREK